MQVRTASWLRSVTVYVCVVHCAAALCDANCARALRQLRPAPPHIQRDTRAPATTAGTTWRSVTTAKTTRPPSRSGDRGEAARRAMTRRVAELVSAAVVVVAPAVVVVAAAEVSPAVPGDGSALVLTLL